MAGAVALGLFAGAASAQAADTVGPSITSITPDTTATYLKGTVTVTVGVADGGSPKSGVFTYECTDNTYLATSGFFSPNNGGQYPNSGTITFTSAGEGLHHILCSAIDAAGNVGQTSSADFLIDNTAPVAQAVVSNQTATSVTVLVSATDPNLNGGGLPGSGVASITTKVDGGSPTTSPDNPRSFTFTTQGAHTIEYWTTDKAGNVSAHKTITVVLDNVKPSGSYNGSSSRTVLRGGGDSDAGPTILSGTASDNRGVTSVSVRIFSAGDSDAGFSQVYTTSCPGCGPTSTPVSWSLNLSTLSPAPPAGVYDTTIIVRDQAGNVQRIPGPTLTFL